MLDDQNAKDKMAGQSIVMAHPTSKLRFLIVIEVLLIMFAVIQNPLLSFADPATRPESIQGIEKEIEQYIRNHPEVILQSLQELEKRRQEEAQQRVKTMLAIRQNELVNDPASPVSGNPDSGVVLVEFYDYRCGFCKRAAPAVSQLQKEDSRVRVVYKDLPILGEPSELAAKAALASQVQGKHQLFHETLLASTGDLTREKILQIANDVGLDIKRLETDMNAPEWHTVIERNRELARDLGITGTPGFIVGTEIRLGALDLNGLKQLLELVFPSQEGR